MFGIGKRTYDSSMTTIYVFLFILLINQFLIVNSFRLMYHNIDEYEPNDATRAVMRRLAHENSAYPEKSLFDDNDLQLFVKPRIERRFCCMSPLLSGRKRSIRDLTKKQIESQQT
ncbi:unnamed protein product [Rotaria sp. Silwood1]|nr:unnamed protein product [Rotaria sp. Silwood1]CAF0960760.1 unnamed protein product [Rotaria sp. Silwood1]CAF3417995.1 unnamed protein product [Rotaria sp. Silwood1]CAF4716278.1 unnamed protein product [Rotaria sp. Silwood1]CAF5043359.1 unnamed protein product [Rotaria sp. Silwood1]